ncbi:hypothetical protein TUMEXPCC7403_24355 [Tumidithrix helvetica PCC 7403]
MLLLVLISLVGLRSAMPVLFSFENRYITKAVLLEAVRGVETHSFSFWDAQIWATARIYQISEIFSEDFNTGSTVEAVSFFDPFKDR